MKIIRDNSTLLLLVLTLFCLLIKLESISPDDSTDGQAPHTANQVDKDFYML